jgi:hypothetical protein
MVAGALRESDQSETQSAQTSATGRGRLRRRMVGWSDGLLPTFRTSDYLIICARVRASASKSLCDPIPTIPRDPGSTERTEKRRRAQSEGTERVDQHRALPSLLDDSWENSIISPPRVVK